MSARVSNVLVERNLAFLRQGRALIEALDDASFVEPAPGTERGGVGAHMRHVLDHYVAFSRDLPSGRIDYDLRERDAELERSRARALEALARAAERLLECQAWPSERALRVVLDCGEHGARMESQSTLARELQFLVSHTVHHYALIAAHLRARGVEPGVDFGVAPSTLKFEQGAAACAR